LYAWEFSLPTTRQTHLQIVPSSVPLKVRREELGIHLNSIVSPKSLFIRVKDELVLARDVDADSVVYEGFLVVDCEAREMLSKILSIRQDATLRTVEDEKQSGPLEYQHLVSLVLEGDVSLRGTQPLVHRLQVVHVLVKLVEVLVPQQLVFDQVELSSSVLERVAVSFSREIHPFRVTKLVTLKVEVALTSERVDNETNHLVQCDSSVNHGSEFAEVRHVGVCRFSGHRYARISV
jgi:hypothetical protein